MRAGEIKLLTCGNCEELKISVHGAALALAAVMGMYNAAAWLVRREAHLAINTFFYTALTAWEMHHVAHHWVALTNVPPAPTRAPSAAGILKTAA